MRITLIIIFSLLTLISCNNDEDENVENNNEIILFSEQARVVGYLPTWRFALTDKIDFCKLTHINIAFGNPMVDGTIQLSNQSAISSLEQLINTAKSQNSSIKFYISLAGGVLSTQVADTWKNFLANSQDRPKLIDKIIEFVLENKLDGVDVDLEWTHVTNGYSDFVIELKQELSAHGKGMTAAFPSEKKFSQISDQALAVFDFINIMAYDYTGSWDPSSPGQHSSYNHAQRGINYWKNIVGIPGEKLTLGVPFYGYDFQNSTTVNSFTYGSMVASNIANSERDQVGNKYYNGRPTIANKVELAAQKLSGIMIWELGQDSFTEYSLLETIHKTYTDLGVKTTELCGN
ncbi:MAG: glycosyl hydrolase family 18 protein [Bacteroidota bacterium]|nr:glycosyl hydrolase family 18 protein [Bacteroidota bacterium]